LDVLVVRKLGVPWQPELGMGALGEGGVQLLNTDVVRAAGVTEGDIARETGLERQELDRRVRRYRAGRPPLPVEGRTVILVDDGLATGGTARAAIEVLRHRGAARVVLAVPVAPMDTLEVLESMVDEAHCLRTPVPFGAIGNFYDDFSQTSDSEVTSLLEDAQD
jgi:putative phosphoribosyl transferase